MFDFAALPPEINSARMYAGPGAAPLLSAASAWNTVAAEMRSTAASYGAVVSELTGQDWFGPSSTSMLAAVTPYVEWLSNTATQAEQTGAQANAAVTAFESAFALTVHPAVVAANRVELATLVATNVFGQNTPAIAATEAQYAEMWAQDAAAMNGYASASSAAAQLTPLTAPESTTDADGAAGQVATLAQTAEKPAGSAQSALSSAATATAASLGSLRSALAGLFSGSDDSALGTFWNGNFFSTAVTNGALAGGPFNPQFILGTVAGFSFLSNTDKAAASAATLTGVGNVPGAAAASGLAGVDSAATAGMGQARLVGTMSVPPSWASAANISPADAALPANGLSDIGTSPAGGQGGFAAPVGANGRRMRRAIPKYGFRPVVMPRPPAAG